MLREDKTEPRSHHRCGWYMLQGLQVIKSANFSINNRSVRRHHPAAGRVENSKDAFSAQLTYYRYFLVSEINRL
jgi:hypothetical protein